MPALSDPNVYARFSVVSVCQPIRLFVLCAPLGRMVVSLAASPMNPCHFVTGGVAAVNCTSASNQMLLFAAGTNAAFSRWRFVPWCWVVAPASIFSAPGMAVSMAAVPVVAWVSV